MAANETVILAEIRDLTHTELWKRTEKFFADIHAPSYGKPSNAEDLSVSPDGKKLAFTGLVWNSLEEGHKSQVYLIDLTYATDQPAGSLNPVAVTRGPHTSKNPKWSPDGKTLMFLSDRLRAGQYQLFSLATDQIGDARPMTSTPLEGIVEEFAWSNDGKSVLIGLAGFGLPKSGFEGSGFLLAKEDGSPAWMPQLKTNQQLETGRSLWVHDVQSRQTRRVSLPGRNVWRFAWCGSHEAIALVSARPEEGAYQESSVVKMSISDGSEQVLIKENGYFFTELTASPTGDKICVIESVGGSRTKLIGEMIWIDAKDNNSQSRLSLKMDVSSIQWTSEDTLIAMGVRDLESIAVDIHLPTQMAHELWSTANACGPSYPKITAVPSGGFVLVRHGWELAPQIGFVGIDGNYHKILDFDHPGYRQLRSQLGPSQTVSWKAPDGLEIRGLLYVPPGAQKPWPLLLHVHGGPFSAFLDHWMGYNQRVPFLVAHGFAVLNPNPRGSLGRGREFTEGVKGDVGGGDSSDVLSGVDYLVDLGVADPARLGVIGASYGGYQAAWLTTKTDLFAASVPISPVTDWQLQWMCGDERQDIFDGQPYNPESLSFHRSPLRRVHLCKTPTLQLVGTLDQCTPPPEAHYYHTALLDHGIKSSIVEYPEEGHGVRRFPAVIDACCRIFSWFNHYMPVEE
ncbi:alpha/beta-hydrolase [Thozetella sp. PMI_491]|nr:alpha/beta-hydrolase [Thozetella sp. PMI_491]